MRVRFCWWLIVLSVVAAAPRGPVVAAPPKPRMVLFKHLENDPNQSYPITDQNGPWMIMAASFSGEQGEAQALELIHELRKDFKLPAYLYQKKFEYSQTVTGKGLDPYGEAPKMRYRRGQDLIEWAVLVGDYQSVDDPEAQKVLKKLKYAQPKSLATADDKLSSLALSELRKVQREFKQKVLPKDSDELKRGPMCTAMVITNPLLPAEYFVPKGIDKFVVEMNKGVPHGLLDCPERYTVKVATFTGHAILLDKKATEAIENGVQPKSWLEDAARNAHVLTEALRKKGYEAYEFHDRASSIVTVGSFGSIGTRRADGKIELNPAVHKIMQTFGAETKIEPGKEAQVGKAKKLAGIPFDVQAVPVEVPQHTISSDYVPTASLR